MKPQIAEIIRKIVTKIVVITGTIVNTSINNYKRILIVLLALSTLLFSYGPILSNKIPTWPEIFSLTGLELEEGSRICTDPLVVAFLDVGQGDSIFIFSEDFKAIIDFGNRGSGQTILSTLDLYGVEKLDAAFVTHPHTDHFGGMSEVLNRIPTDKLILPRYYNENDNDYEYFASIYDSVKYNVGELILADRDYNISIKEPRTEKRLELDVLGPLYHAEDVNDMSLVLKLTFGQTSFLFTGDSSTFEEYSLLSYDYKDNINTLDADILKVGHHGSDSSSCKDFLDVVSPKIAVISVGKDNDYGHPKSVVLDRLNESGAQIRRTDKEGTIIIGVKE